ncbi:hypothetical protein [Deinococcus marmoris]|uniref:hypothetical protein n=1 Tax=Deinococcus marmoris TaxID=249408 RepID=UPI0012DD3BC3|nr:hypothetical protein [Deinococcus marmoris]
MLGGAGGGVEVLAVQAGGGGDDLEGFGEGADVGAVKDGGAAGNGDLGDVGN